MRRHADGSVSNGGRRQELACCRAGGGLRVAALETRGLPKFRGAQSSDHIGTRTDAQRRFSLQCSGRQAGCRQLSPCPLAHCTDHGVGGQPSRAGGAEGSRGRRSSLVLGPARLPGPGAGPGWAQIYLSSATSRSPERLCLLKRRRRCRRRRRRLLGSALPAQRCSSLPAFPPACPPGAPAASARRGARGALRRRAAEQPRAAPGRRRA